MNVRIRLVALAPFVKIYRAVTAAFVHLDLKATPTCSVLLLNAAVTIIAHRRWLVSAGGVQTRVLLEVHASRDNIALLSIINLFVQKSVNAKLLRIAADMQIRTAMVVLAFHKKK